METMNYLWINGDLVKAVGLLALLIALCVAAMVVFWMAVKQSEWEEAGPEEAQDKAQAEYDLTRYDEVEEDNVIFGR